MITTLLQALQGRIENILFMEQVDSTHALAVRLISQMDDEGLPLVPTLVLAGRQSSGRGRGDRGWQSPAGGLYLSWVSSGLQQNTVAALPMVAAAAARDAIAALGVARVGIKWPNDILIENRKLAGLLVHARHGEKSWATVGLGVNLASTPKINEPGVHPAVALAELLPADGAGVWTQRIAVEFVAALSDAMVQPEPALQSWRQNIIHQRGDTMTVRLGSGDVAEGVFAGLTREGFLRLRQEQGERLVTSGDVIGSV